MSPQDQIEEVLSTVELPLWQKEELRKFSSEIDQKRD